MQLKEIKIGDLPDFVESELWQQLRPKPITTLRALSQFHNPRADLNDIALVIAYENEELIGLVGLLPHLVNGQKGQKTYSNTCWWAHPQKGKQLAIPLLYKAFAVCGQRIFMTDCTPHTLSILEKTKWFEFPDTPLGMRGFLKFNLHEIIPAKFPSTFKWKPLLRRQDQTLNFLLSPYRKLIHSRFTGNVYSSDDLKSLDEYPPKVKYLTSLNQELYTYIETHSLNEFTRRSGPDLEWILQFPWVKAKKGNQPFHIEPYPFSFIVENFEQYFIQITSMDQTIGLLFISVRDSHMKIPYAYFDEKDSGKVLQVIYQQAVLKNAITLTIFNPALVKSMETMAHPFIFRKRIKRLMAVSKQLSDNYHQFPKLQDGDGDVVFT